MGKRFPIALGAALLGMGQGQAADPRIRQILYQPDNVFVLEAAAGYAVVVELADDEHIDNIVVGNSAAWQVTANKRGDRLVVKPLSGAVPTDMVVTTDARNYVFALQTSDAAPFVLRFSYPQTSSAPAAIANPVARYAMRGRKDLYPIAMTDDGQRVTIRWGHNSPLPAIYAINDEGQEAIVNGRMADGDFVIEGVVHRYIFRRDKAHATATRMPFADRR